MAPPPPPPGPPPPPMMPVAAAMPSGQERGLLLQSIRKGTTLKKTVTVDKSKPLVSGRIAGTNSSNSNNESSREIVSNNSPRVNGGPSGLGGLFAGGMPKLKPTGLSTITGSTTNSVTSKDSLAAKGYLETKNRGPPPQPPPASQKPTISTSASDSVLTTSPANNGYTIRPTNGPPVLPSKPPVGGYGKPNVAPKPPVMREPSSPHYVANQSSLHQHSNSIGGSSQNLSDYTTASSQNLSNFSQSDQGNKPSPPPKKVPPNGRPISVNRAQSMRTPRSPSVAPNTNPPFPPNAKHNLVKNQSSLHQSQDGLNYRNYATSKMGTLPPNFQKTPPNMPPPPTPNQSQRVGTPTRPPVTRPPPPPSRPSNAPQAPPPPPPHRTTPAPPPPPPSQSSMAPTPPVRNLSMRNGPHTTEIEVKFASLFHNVQEFPEPEVFRNVPKAFNTRTHSNAKQPAPPPPVHSQAPTHVQLNSKLWLSNTSQC